MYFALSLSFRFGYSSFRTLMLAIYAIAAKSIPYRLRRCLPAIPTPIYAGDSLAHLPCQLSVSIGITPPRLPQRAGPSLMPTQSIRHDVPIPRLAFDNKDRYARDLRRRCRAGWLHFISLTQDDLRQPRPTQRDNFGFGEWPIDII
jgi:hypothetical protein